MALEVGRYRITRVDASNLRAYEWRTVVGKGRNKDAGPRERWVPLEAYFGTMDAALAWLYDRMMSDAIAERDMDAASLLAACRATERELLRAIDARKG